MASDWSPPRDDQGRYDLAIVALNTAFEVLVFGVATVLLADNGWDTEAIDDELTGRLGVATVCHRFIEPRIGGRWDNTDTACAFGQMNRDVVDLRNGVVHEGHAVSLLQVGPAFEAFNRFTEFVTTRAGTRRRQFPRTFMDLVNTFGPASGSAVGRTFDDVASAIVAATLRYWLPTGDPRQVSDPPAIVEGRPGFFPGTAGQERRTHRETTSEPFMHLVLRPAPTSTDDETEPDSSSS